jgi:chromosome partitioning protein
MTTKAGVGTALAAPAVAVPQKALEIISCVNLKGGVGKTAIATNFAAFCGRAGKKTLLVDLDPQTNATFSCMDVDDWEKHAKEHGSVADLFGLRSHTNAEGRVKEAKDVLHRNAFVNVDLVPSHLDLFTIDLDLAAAPAREKKLQKALRPLLGDYEIVVCDCPPNLTLPTQNALSLSTHYLVPISPDYLSAIGVALLITRVKQLAEDLDHSIELAGIVISRVGRPAFFRSQTVAALRKTFGAQVLAAEIKERTAVSEAAAKHKPIYEMNDRDAVEEFNAMSREVLKRIGVNV